MKTWVISVAVLIAIRLVPAFSSFERVSRSGRDVQFNLNTPFRVAEASLFGIVLGTLLTPILVGSWRSEWWQMLVAIIGGGLLAHIAPGKIVVNDDGITEKRLLGVRHIKWPEVESIIQDNRKQKVIVTGNDGTEIIHTDMHVSEREFLRKLERLNLKVSHDSKLT